MQSSSYKNWGIVLNNTYPNTATLYQALTRPALLFGITIEYFFFSLTLTLSLVILLDRVLFMLVFFVFYVGGRFIFYWDMHLISIIFRTIGRRGNSVYRALGQWYYDVY